MKHMPSEAMMPVFASTKLKLHPANYMIASLPVEEQEKVLDLFKLLSPFSSVTLDLEEISLILKEEDWASLKEYFPVYEIEGPYRVITFDIVLDLSLIGFLSVVSAVLADEEISIYAVSTFLRDHILVKAADAEKAVRALSTLIQKCDVTN